MKWKPQCCEKCGQSMDGMFTCKCWPQLPTLKGVEMVQAEKAHGR